MMAKYEAVPGFSAARAGFMVTQPQVGGRWNCRVKKNNSMKNRNLAVSYKSRRSDFPPGSWLTWSFDKKVRLFEEQIQGWVIDVAREIKRKQIPHADFSILSILLSYFESIAKFIDGYTGFEESGEYFEKGIKSVYPKRFQKRAIMLLYRQARNSMYHVGLTGPKIEIDCLIDSGVEFKSNKFILCPEKMIEEIQTHFTKYCENLKDARKHRLRLNFMERYRFLVEQ